MKILICFTLTALIHSASILAAAEPPKKPEKAGTEEKSEAKAKCPICDKDANPKCKTKYEKKTYTFNSAECRKKWKKQRAESIYQRLGGAAAMDAAIEKFYVKVLADERINEFFEDVDMKRQARKQNAFLSAAFGGPVPWKGKDMRKAHANLDGITDAHFDAVAENLQLTLTELKIDEALIAEVMAIAGSVRDDVLNRDKAPQKGEKKSAEKKAG